MIDRKCELGRERCRWCWEESQQTPFDWVIVPPTSLWHHLPSLERLSLVPQPDRAIEAIWHMAQVGV